MESFHAFSKDAAPSVVSEVQRSVSLFFDGVEAGLIWSTLAAVIRDAVQPEGFAPIKLDLATWILNTFNLRDEEMITVHARLVAVLLLGKLCMQNLHAADHDYARALQVANGLVDLIPPRAFVNASTDAQVRPQTKESTEGYVKAVTQFYERKQQNLSTSSQPFDGHTTGTLLLRMAVNLTLRSLQTSLGPVFQGNLQVLLVIVTKVPDVDHAANAGLLDAISETLSKSPITGTGVALPTLTLRLRNKTRYLLEQMFAAEPLESLEGIVTYWRSEARAERAGAVINLFQVMQGSRPKHVLPAILDSLCSRIVPSALPPARQSSQSTELTADDVSIFLLAYLRSTEDDAMDEIWVDCITFVRDVLANPMPYRHHMPALLALVHLLSQKVANTKYGEQKRMRKDLADTFLKLLAATFTTMSSGSFAEAGQGGTRSGLRDDANPDSIRPLLVLRSIVDDIGTILDSQDRIATVMTSISTSVLTPVIHSKAFPSSLSSEHLDLLLSVAKKAPTSKTWKKDVTEAFNDPRLLTTPPDVLKGQWLPILYQWTARDKDRMTELLSRLTAPTTAGIMFGVGANAARLEADRRTQLNLRRLCLLLQSSPEDTWVSYLRDLDEKLVELFAATASSSPSAAIKADLYVLCRALILAFSAVHLAPLWPTINSNLQAALTSILGSQKISAFTNLSILQACKLLDQLVMLSPDEFQLHEWLYIADTVDAVYRPTEYAISALADQVAESLGPIGSDEDRMIATPTVSNGESGHRRRRLLLHGISIETDDIKAMERDEFFSTVLRPFLSQLSIHAYEGLYSMEAPDVEACRQSLLEDLTDLKTIVS
ncbi:hypothetical protein LTR53_013928 [Teratosphaeriaceae sp. CCFEE 6253]|nr:hypothetical protein LTR53_013928 [Teratosphaeriaceae sp. CCFEE 6253]